jgi:hypothetical protein
MICLGLTSDDKGVERLVVIPSLISNMLRALLPCLAWNISYGYCLVTLS